MPTAELLRPKSLNIEGKLMFKRGVPQEVDHALALQLAEDGRFKVTGLSAQEATEIALRKVRPQGEELLEAIREAAEELDDHDANFDRSGKPSVAVLSNALGYQITEIERDRALYPTQSGGQLENASGGTETTSGKRTGNVTIKRVAAAAAPKAPVTPAANAPAPAASGAANEEGAVEV